MAHQTDSLSRTSLDAAFPVADEIVARYASLLEAQTANPFLRESSLPEGKDAVKTALVVVAIVRRANGWVSEDEVRLYRNAYTRLMYLVPDERVDAIGRALELIGKAGGVDALSPEQVREAARNIALAHQPGHTAQFDEEMIVLPVEFDAQVAAGLKVYRAGGA
jgi:hypothetical protein